MQRLAVVIGAEVTGAKVPGAEVTSAEVGVVARRVAQQNIYSSLYIPPIVCPGPGALLIDKFGCSQFLLPIFRARVVLTGGLTGGLTCCMDSNLVIP